MLENILVVNLTSNSQERDQAKFPSLYTLSLKGSDKLFQL